MIVYHGSISTISSPDVSHSYRNLDFGKGFYVTANYDQAVKWARRKARLNPGENAIINSYQMCDVTDSFFVKTFPADLSEWIDFVCRCRDGSEEYLKYDIVMGKVADDKVFRVVDMYNTGIWDKERALKEIKAYPEYDQIAFISQKAIDELLVFQSSKEV